MRTSIFLLFVFSLSLVLAHNNASATECNASFTFALNTTVMSVVPATAIDFYDTSTGDATEWHWDFGDENTSSEQNPMHVYVLPFYNDSMKVKINPYRTVILRIANSTGCSSEYAETINIYEPFPIDYTCSAAFKYYLLSYDSLAQTATFQLRDYSEGDSLTYSWWFDNGETSTIAEPQVTFDLSQPERKVCLTVSGAYGCSDTFCDPVWVLDPADTDPTFPPDTIVADCFVSFRYEINYDVQTFAPSLTLNFYSKPDGEVEKYVWDFGDGNTSNEANPVHSFNYPTVEDSILGDPNPFRTVCLTITTTNGCESTWCEVINVYMTDVTTNDCDASFKYAIPEDIVTIPEIIPFKFYSTGANIVAWNWYFEDGTESHEAEPIAYFDFLKETQQVCLSIVTADSCMSKTCETIYISSGIVDTFYIEPTCGYSFKYSSSYPAEASACIGKISAQVVLGDSAVETEYYYWLLPDGTMIDGPELNNLCPTQTYRITALTTDGCKFSESFVFNSDGSVTVLPLNWWFSGLGDDTYIEYQLPDSGYYVEWILCDGTVVTGDSILLNSIDCGTDKANMVVRDAAGKVVYTEIIGNKTGVKSIKESHQMLLYPNPVNDVLTIESKVMNVSPGKFEINNLKGERVLQGNWPAGNQIGITHVNVSTLKSGVYFARLIYTDGLVVTQRFCK